MIDVEETASAAAQVNDPSLNTDASERSDTTTTESAETTAAEQPKPGTPDKALQRMQQEVGNLSRQYAALMEKKAEGELTEADRTKLEKSKQRLETIRSKAQDFGLSVDGGTELAEQVLDLTEKVNKQDAIEAENRDMKARLELLENDRTWQIVKTKYPALDTDAIWEKAQKDAAETLADDATPRAVRRLASRWFEERCEAAKKRQGDPDPKNKKDPPPAQQYRVGSGQNVPPQLSETEAILQEARKLVREI